MNDFKLVINFFFNCFKATFQTISENWLLSFAVLLLIFGFIVGLYNQSKGSE